MKLVNLFRYVFAGKGIIDVSNIDSTNVERIKQRIEKRSTEIKNEFEFILKDENLSNPFRTMLLQLNTPNALSLEKILFDSKEVQTSSIPEKFIMPAEEKLQEVFKEKIVYMAISERMI